MDDPGYTWTAGGSATAESSAFSRRHPHHAGARGPPTAMTRASEVRQLHVFPTMTTRDLTKEQQQRRHPHHDHLSPPTSTTSSSHRSQRGRGERRGDHHHRHRGHGTSSSSVAASASRKMTAVQLRVFFLLCVTIYFTTIYFADDIVAAAAWLSDGDPSRRWTADPPSTPRAQESEIVVTPQGVQPATLTQPTPSPLEAIATTTATTTTAAVPATASSELTVQRLRRPNVENADHGANENDPKDEGELVTVEPRMTSKDENTDIPDPRISEASILATPPTNTNLDATTTDNTRSNVGDGR